MKVALCLYGQVGGINGRNGGGGWLHPKSGKNFLDKILIEKYRPDVFVHSWSDFMKDAIVKTYQPKSFIIEPQINFSHNFSDYGFENPEEMGKIKSYQALLNTNERRKSYQAIRDEVFSPGGLAFRSQSRWYSIQQSVNLMRSFEDENNFKYDFVLISRFDLWYLRKLDLERLDPCFIYAGPRTDGSPPEKPVLYDKDQAWALEDMWFLGGSDLIHKFGNLYEDIFNYSARPTWASRERIKDTIGEEKLKYMWWHHHDYGLLRAYRYQSQGTPTVENNEWPAPVKPENN